MSQTVDTVAHDKAHGAGIVIWPDTFSAVSLLGFNEVFSDKIERRVPGDAFELAGALRALRRSGCRSALRMVLPLCIACDLGADHTGGVIVVRGPCTRPIVRSSSNSTSSAQVDGQSCGQAEWPIRFALGSLTV